MNSTLTNTAASKDTGRIHVIDVLRGFALFGIIIVHASTAFNVDVKPFLGHVNPTLRMFVYLFIAEKFYLIFSFMFGLSFIIQLNNAVQKNRPFTAVFIRRSVVLFLIGFLHVQYYTGDILRMYACFSIVLLLFYRFNNTWLLVLSTVLMFAQSAVFKNWNPIEISFIEIRPEVFMVPSMFLLGMVAGKTGLFIQSAKSSRFWKITCPISLVITTVGTAYFVVAGAPKNFGMMIALGTVCRVFMSSFYVSGLVLLYWHTPLNKALNAFRPIGKLGLTTYVTQSMFGVLFFYPAWLNMQEKLTEGQAILSCLIFFGFEMVASWIWFKYFKYGPFEWVWRSLTYLKAQPFLKTDKPATTKPL